MKIPRDLSGQDLIKLLKKYGYTISRQTGSHIRITTLQDGEHHLTIPNHDPLKLGTLSAILTDIALHHGKTKDDLLKELFG
jgi:predicted RNA binding protein YcfA (HicA-like mRNA interferase family)